MENLIFLLTASLVLYQSKKKFRKTFIGNTNCSVFFSAGAEFGFTKSDEGDELYFSEHTEKNSTYGILCAQLNEMLPLQEALEIMSTYLSSLQKPFSALYSTGAMISNEWEQEHCVKLVDYWQDQEQQDWKVKGYTNGHIIAVLYVKNIGDLEVEKQDSFLDSFSFAA
jgi:hypothetical protein